MFQNYFVTALRNIARHKLYSFINIAGFAMGLACAIFIILFVRDELSYDKWIAGSDGIYRIEGTIQVPGRGPLALAVIPWPVAGAMRDEVPGVVDMTRFWEEGITLTTGNRQFFEGVRVVDPGFFRMIRLPLIAGDPDQVFRNPDSLVMSEKAARKYFGDANPIGKTLVTGRGNCSHDPVCAATTVTLTVTGIMRDLPHNSQLDGDVFLPNTSSADHMYPDARTDWFSQNGWGFVKLAPGADPKAVAAAMAPVLDRNLTGEVHKFGIRAQGHEVYALHLTPFSQVHLNSEQWRFNTTPPGSWTTVYGVGAIGVLILLVACFNFMNLATARASLRAREICLRKTLGATRPQLIAQFLGESLLMALIALMLALALVEVLLPVFSDFLRKPIAFHYLADWPLLLLILGIAAVAGLISGSYPALVLSGFRPVSVLRANTSGQAGSGSLRTILVVAQFAVSIGLGIAALVVSSQINYARGLDMGFRHDNIVIVSGGGLLTASGKEGFTQTLRGHPGVMAVGLSNISPLDNGQSLANVQVPGHSEMLTLNKITIDPGFPQVYGVKLVAGRMLSAQREPDKFFGQPFTGNPANEGHNIVVNEAGAARLGYSSEGIVGKTILYTGSHVTVVGVLADAKFGGAREPVKPTSFIYDPTYPAEVAILLRPDRIPETLAFIDKSWHAFAPSVAVRRRFLDAAFDKLYQADQRQGTMFGIFVAIAILIACLGLFGLAAFTAGRRTREIGIRKVFGARDRDVVKLLLWQFSIPVLLANLIAWPLAWYYLQDWLQNFAFRISLDPLYFVATGLVALLIAWITILGHALRVARANPIHALRTE